MFLGIRGQVEDFEVQEGKRTKCAFSISYNDNPLTDFVELPENLINLDYFNIICGVVRGALSTVKIIIKLKKNNERKIKD